MEKYNTEKSIGRKAIEYVAALGATAVLAFGCASSGGRNIPLTPEQVTGHNGGDFKIMAYKHMPEDAPAVVVIYDTDNVDITAKTILPDYINNPEAFDDGSRLNAEFGSLEEAVKYSESLLDDHLHFDYTKVKRPSKFEGVYIVSPEYDLSEEGLEAPVCHFWKGEGNTIDLSVASAVPKTGGAGGSGAGGAGGAGGGSGGGAGGGGGCLECHFSYNLPNIIPEGHVF